MIRFENINQLKQTELVEGDLIELFGEFQEGDGAVMYGRVVPVDKVTINRKVILETNTNLAVEIYPSGRTVTEVYVDGSISNFHTDAAVPYQSGYTLTKLTDKVLREGKHYLPRYIPLTLTTWEQDEDKFKYLPINITEDTITEEVESIINSNHANIHAQSKFEFDSERASFKLDYIGSGMIKSGSTSNSEPIGKGLNGSTTEVYTMTIGSGAEYLIDGVKIKPAKKFEIPPAPMGTVVKHANNTTTDFMTYDDPRYGSVAPHSRAATSRAFSGLLVNGDFELGSFGWTNSGVVFTDRKATLSANDVMTQIIPQVSGKTYHLTCDHATTAGQFNITVNGVNVFTGSGSGTANLTWVGNVTGNAEFKVTANASCNSTIRGIYVEEDGAGVITTRRDCLYLWVRYEALDENDIVHVDGDVQYDQSTWNGITLSNELVPQAYSAYGAYDTVTKGYGARWSSLTDIEKIKFIEHKSNHIYYDDVTDTYYQAKFGRKVIQGIKDGDLDDTLALENIVTDSTVPFQYKLSTDTKVIPLCLIQRLNQGAFDPVWNGFGCGARLGTTGTSWSYQWHNGMPTRCPRDTFKFTGNLLGYDSYPFLKGVLLGAGLRVPETSNGTLLNHDGFSSYGNPYVHFDAVYAGQVEDVRTDVNHKDLNAVFRRQLQKDIQWESRGIGQVTFTRVFNTQADANANGYTLGETAGGKFVAYKILTPKFNILPAIDLICSPTTHQNMFPKGTMGKWLPVIPDNNTRDFLLTRKGIGTVIKWEALPYGSAWQSGTGVLANQKNGWTVYISTGNMGLWHYPAITPITEPVATSLPSVIDRSDVLITSSYRLEEGNALSNSLSNEISKDDNNPTTYSSRQKYSSAGVDYFADGFIAPDNNSKKVALIASLVNKDGYLYMQYNAKVGSYVNGSWDNGNSISFTSDIIHHSIYPVAVAE